MNETIKPDVASTVPWPTSGARLQVPDPSRPQGSEKAPAAAVGMLEHAVQGAHDTIDRIAGGAAPVVKQLGTSVDAAAEALTEKTHRLRETRDEWAEGARSTVRSHPLRWVAAAFALGVVFARLTR